MKRYIILFTLLFSGVQVLAQTPSDSLPDTKQLTPHFLKPFTIEAKIISFLQGHDNLAVLQVTKAKENEWKLKPGDEILVTFMLKPSSSQSAKSGDLIQAETLGSMNKNTVQVDYRIMRYSILEVAKEDSKAPSAHESHK